jgi:hypothetical protein
VPDDCGIKISKRRFAPRVGLAYRITNTLVFRAGYGITNDPFIGTELLRAEYPVLTPLVIDVPNSFQPAGTLENGIPAITAPAVGNGVIDIPGTYAYGGYPKDFKRGYLQSWNATFQKQLRYDFVAELGYVATRQTRQLGYLDINSGQVIGADQGGRPLFQKFGRTAATTFITPLGTGQYNAMQARLERRFSMAWSSAPTTPGRRPSAPLITPTAPHPSRQFRISAETACRAVTIALTTSRSPTSGSSPSARVGDSQTRGAPCPIWSAAGRSTIS